MVFNGKGCPGRNYLKALLVNSGQAPSPLSHHPSGIHLDMVGTYICPVGDSDSMVVHSHDTTLPMSLEEMPLHCRTVASNAHIVLLGIDAADTAVKLLKEEAMDAIKLRGSPARVTAAKAIVEAGIAGYRACWTYSSGS
ncbi:hypothetical protein V6N13_138065 [Hibiscus sabdariffa]